mmetsp:Transcript_9676/g.29279  ORF Transcript_9676/g.29279 Transcript_9676/m.29279 type:complete len:188 (+) Transcript_9676:844-1407(+)
MMPNVKVRRNSTMSRRRSIVLNALMPALVRAQLDACTTSSCGETNTQCLTELKDLSSLGNMCTCPPGTTECNISCGSSDVSIPDGCRQDFNTGEFKIVELCPQYCPPVVNDRETDTTTRFSDAELILRNVRGPTSCESTNPCTSCQPICQTGYIWVGPPLWCNASSTWDRSGGGRSVCGLSMLETSI